MEETKVVELKAKMFDLMREQTILQAKFNELEQQKQTLLQELQKLEVK